MRILSRYSPRRLVARWPLRILVACVAATAAACGGGDGGAPTGSSGNATPLGSLTITVEGLPPATPAAISVTGPGGFSRTVSATETLTSLTPGTYQLTAMEVSVSEDRYAPASTSTSATVPAAANASTTVSYNLRTGSLTIAASGLPAGSVPNVTVTGPGGFSRTVVSGSTLRGLTPGTYQVAAAALVIDDATYSPAASLISVAVTASSAPVPASIPFQLASGSLIVSVAGLPAGTQAQARVTGPDGFSRAIGAGETLHNLVPGAYTITGDPITVSQDGYRVQTPLVVQVVASPASLAATVTYTLSTGRLSITVSGTPLGANAAVTVTGPGGFSQLVTSTQHLVGLVPGEYTVTAANVVAGSATYGATPASQQLSVPASQVPVPATVAYSLTTGSISVAVTGLPQAVSAAVTVSGPNGYVNTVTTSTTLGNLKPGSYTLTAGNATAGTHVYTATPDSRNVTVTAGVTPVSATFAYALSTGGIALSVSGLPNDVAAAITVTGPNGYVRILTGTTLLLGLPAGTYTASAQVVQSGSAYWAPNPASQQVVVVPSTSAIAATVNYVTATGTLVVTVNGLPNGTSAGVVVTGPNSYNRSVSATTTLTGLLQGVYNVAASNVTSGATTYTPSAASQNVMIGGGATSGAVVTYTSSGAPPPPPPAGLNLTIEGMHVQQVVQTFAGAVPLVAGRDGLLRIFVKASGANSATPTVRVRFYSGASLTSTITINAPGAAVPQAIAEGTLTSSWNYTIPGALMQPGLKILADVDPANAVTESAEGDNTWPTSGSAATMDVRSVPTFNLRLVPVLQSVNGLQGGVTGGNASSYTADTRKLFPLGTVDTDVRAAFTTNAPVLQSGDGNGAWGQILSEINALRTADGSARHYYGLVKVNYSSGIAGLGYVPGRASIGWDYLPSASGVMAHEVGHNFGRFHAPSCGAGGPDPSYPHADGKIGVYGYDIAANALRAPGAYYDLMGYCGNEWISDYTFTAVLNYRSANPITTTAAAFGSRQLAGTPRRGLLVWGRVQQGQVTLEPSFEVTAPPALPQRPGANRVQGFGPLGETLFDLAFDGEHVADHPDPSTQHFAFVIPIDAIGGTAPTRLRLNAPIGRAELTSSAPSGAPTEVPILERIDAARVRVRWNPTENRGVLVRHPGTGAILAFGRGGEAVVFTRESILDVTTSDGVRSAHRRVSVGSPRGPLR